MLVGKSFKERPASFEVPALMNLELVISGKIYAASMKIMENCFQSGVYVESREQKRAEESSRAAAAEQSLHSIVLISQIFA